MDENDNWEEEEEEEFEFSRNYFLAKEVASSVKKSTHKVTDLNVVDEQVPIVVPFVSPLSSLELLLILNHGCSYLTRI